MHWLLLISLLLASPALAQSTAATAEPDEGQRYVFVYVDGDGQLHFVDRLELVPAQYRAQARKSELTTTGKDREEALRSAAKKRAAKRNAEVQAAAKAEMKARIEARDAEQAEQAEAPDAEAEEPEPRSKKAQLADALAERLAVLEELALLEEGWAEDADQPEAALLQRLNHLEKRLTELDAEVATLK